VKEAKPGDVVVEVRCRCDGAVLTAEYSVPNWRCGQCRRRATPGKRFRFDKAMQLVELAESEVA
jgi:hypothetical protein